MQSAGYRRSVGMQQLSCWGRRSGRAATPTAAAATPASSKRNGDCSADFVWENQRFYYFVGWHTSLDGPSRWTDAAGHAIPEDQSPGVVLRAPETQQQSSHRSGEDNDAGWVVEVSTATDSSGWQYARMFSDFDTFREGGRAGRRPTDFVRRRKWWPATYASGEMQQSMTRDTRLLSPQAVRAADTARQHSYSSTAMTAVRAVMAMLSEAGKRGAGVAALTADPLSWNTLASEHSVWLQNMQAFLMPGALMHEGDADAAGNDDGPASNGAAGPAGNASNGNGAGDSSPRHGDAARFYAGEMPRRPSGGPGAARSAQTPAGRARGSDKGVLTAAMIEDMTAAIDFSRAAYAYAFLAGGMASITRYLHMQTLQRGVFDIIGGVSAEANTQSISAIAGIPVKDVLFADWNNTTYRPCHFLAVDHARERLVIAVRGSLEIGDLLTDLHAKPIEVTLGNHPTAHVHEGMLRAAAYVHANTAQALSEAAAKYPGYSLMVTGHSLGGGVATLLTVLLQQPKGAPAELQTSGIQAVTIAGASAVSEELAVAVSPYVTSIILGSDAVPRLSAHTVELLIEELSRRSVVSNVATSLSSLGRTLTKSVAGITRGVGPGGAAAAATGSVAADGSVEMVPLRGSTGYGDAMAAREGSLGTTITDAATSAQAAVTAADRLSSIAPHERTSLPSDFERTSSQTPQQGESTSGRESRGTDESQTAAGFYRKGSAALARGAPRPEGGVTARDAASFDDARTNADAMASVGPRREETASLWSRLLTPVNAIGGMLGGVTSGFGGGGNKPGSRNDDAQLKPSRKELPAGDKQEVDLLSHAVDNPLEYLKKSGISPKNLSPRHGDGGVKDKEGGDPQGAPTKRRRQQLAHAPSGVRAVDDAVLQSADEGHAATAADDSPPVPLVPAGRVLWILPVKRGNGSGKNGNNGNGGLVTVSSQALPSDTVTLPASAVFRARSNASDYDGSEAASGGPLSPIPLQARADAATDANGGSKADEQNAVGATAPDYPSKVPALDDDAAEEAQGEDGARPPLPRSLSPAYASIAASVWDAGVMSDGEVDDEAPQAAAIQSGASSARIASDEFDELQQTKYVLEKSDGIASLSKCGSASNAAAPAEAVVLDVTEHRDLFNYFTLSSDMIQDHVPDSYTRAVAQLRRQHASKSTQAT